MESFTRLTAEQRSNFVAYLDGELNEEKAQQIEKMLAQSEVARHEIEALAKTWELLDQLPKAEATEEFTQRTMATATMSNGTSVPLTEHPAYLKAKQGAIWTGWVAGVAISTVVGFMLTATLIPNPMDELIEDLPVIENFDRYQEIGEIEFLERLNKQPEWQKWNETND